MIILAFALVGCGGNGAQVDGEGCDGLENGPFAQVTAGTGMDDTAGAITIDGAFTVTLPASGVGFLAFDSQDDTEYIVFADRPIAVAAFTPEGVEIMAQARATSTDVCTIVMRRDIIELPVGLFYFGLGPDTGTVNVVLRPFDPD
jgi:hypothetical protein